MYGLITKISAQPGKREALVDVLIDGSRGMAGCVAYVVAADLTDEHAVWITELWDERQSHQASLSLQSVKDAIAKGRPLIAGFALRAETTPAPRSVSRAR